MKVKKPLIFSKKPVNKKVLLHDIKSIIDLHQEKESKEKLLKKLIIVKNDTCLDELLISNKDKEPCTVLMYACEQGWVDGVKAIIESRAKVNVPDEDGDNALCWALDCDNKQHINDIVKLLIQKSKSNPYKKNKGGKTAIDRARANGLNTIANEMERLHTANLTAQKPTTRRRKPPD